MIIMTPDIGLILVFYKDQMMGQTAYLHVHDYGNMFTMLKIYELFQGGSRWVIVSLKKLSG